MKALVIGIGGVGLVVLSLPFAVVLLIAPDQAAGSCGVTPANAAAWSQQEITQLWIASGGSTGTTNVTGIGPVADPVIAGAVAMAESAGDPNVVNSIGAGGLFQIHPPEPNYLDPATNAKIAVRKFKASGWLPWEAYTGRDGRGDDGPWRAYLVLGAGPELGGAVCSGGDLTGPGRDIPGGTGPWLAGLPGAPGIQCDARIVPDVEALERRYHAQVTACYAPVGHAAGGEHPLGLATDLVPGPGGTWDDLDRLAHDTGWIASCGASGVRPACPLGGAWRFVGWDGYPGHGRGLHLHLSWAHGPGRPAETVTVFTTEGTA